MDLDRELLNKIRQMDDDGLRSVIANVAQNMGIDSSLTDMYLNDMKQIKDTVASLTQKDLDRLQSAIGKENTRALMDHIRAEINGK